MRNWNISEVIVATLIAEYPDMHPVILQLLANRGITSKSEIGAFLNPRYEDLCDPFLFRDMQKAVDRVACAREKGETVFVYGDYDADGVTSSLIMVETLRACGIKTVGIYIPHREKEGYGLHTGSIDYIAEQGATLVIVVDSGTSSVSEVAYAVEKGLDVIVCDHHEEPKELPQGLSAFLNPHVRGETYPFKNLAACGVVFKFSQALWKSFNLPSGQEKWFLDLVAIGTVADMMDLVGENRIFVAFGLTVLNKTKRQGLRSLISEMQIKSKTLGTYEIGFMIAPRLNAAGRLDHANTAYTLLETQDMAVASEFAQSLNQTNVARQSETVRIFNEAKEQVSSQVSKNKVLVAVGADWPVGIVGLVSGRITEKFWRPSLVITTSEKGLVGSGRSIPGFNITDALSQASEYLERFGGHEGACGFTIKSESMLQDFIQKLNQIADATLSQEALVKHLTIDMELGLEQIDWELVSALDTFGPYGIGNPSPVFASFGLRVADVFLMGAEKQHMRIKLEQHKATHQAVLFGFSKHIEGTLNQGDLIDMAYSIDINEYHGRRDIQLKVVAIKKL
ncbi:single-stranded-DNA-specific exonuclease RecJ [bacterium CG10_46_32]|nr:MAG: single-stranded-DNA-specific exonuclease RecJ [bacterium CG10_46_32]PIR55838.1 MAG: single-stranded-DNA-specific exonuclease RecJ [Parcubacteria group bacterium CG10_big_fil_rev_8_21_14_0_10_46_32]